MIMTLYNFVCSRVETVWHLLSTFD